MSWVYLFFAIGFEVIATTAMKYTNGFTKPLPIVIMVIFYIGSFYLLGMSLKKIDISIAYAVWSAIGTAAVCVIGWICFKEKFNAMKIISILIIILGTIMLNLSGKNNHT